MVERSLSMREVAGSMPASSSHFFSSCFFGFPFRFGICLKSVERLSAKLNEVAFHLCVLSQTPRFAEAKRMKQDLRTEQLYTD